MTFKHKQRCQAILGLLFAGGFLYLSIKDVSLDIILDRLSSMTLIHLPACLLLYVLFFWLKTIRWRLLVSPLKKLSDREIFPALIIGFMGNNVLPAHLGEFLRMYVLSREHKLSKTAVLSTIVLERLLDFLVITGTFAVVLQCLPEIDAMPEAIRNNMRTIRFFGLLVGAGSLGAFLFFLFYVHRTRQAMALSAILLKPMPRFVREKVLNLLTLGVQGLYSLKQGRVLLVMLLISVVHWGLNATVLYLAAISFPPENDIPLLAAPLLLSVCALGITLPTAPGFFGTMQFCFTSALAVFGISGGTAFAASIYALLMGYIPVTATGFFFLSRMGLKLSSLKVAVDEEKQAEARAAEEAAETTGRAEPEPQEDKKG